MSTVVVPSTATPASKPGLSRLLLVNIPYFALYLISVWLIALTDENPIEAATRWQLFIPLVALVSVIDGWHDTRGPKPTYLIQQVLHWGALMAATWLLFLPEMESYMNAESHGFIAAYMLGLTAILSGIYFEWKMSVFGAFLIASAVGIAFLSDNALMMTLIGGAVLGIVITLLLRRRRAAEV